MENEKLNNQNIEQKAAPKIAKYRKAGWIATAILTALMLAMLVAYFATGGTYGLDQNAETTAIAAEVAQHYGLC